MTTKTKRSVSKETDLILDAMQNLQGLSARITNALTSMYGAKAAENIMEQSGGINEATTQIGNALNGILCDWINYTLGEIEHQAANEI